MKIAMIGLRGIPANYGGVERVVEAMSTRLVESGHAVTVFCCAPFTPKRREYKRVRLVRIPTIPQKHLTMPIYAFLSSLWVRFQEFDIIHCHSVDPIFFSLIRSRDKRLVCTSHGQAYRRGKWGVLAKWISRQAERKFLKHIPTALCVSQTLKRHYEAISGREVTFIPNGAEIVGKQSTELLDHLKLTPGNYCVFVGRLEPTKACHVAIEAHRRAGLNMPLVVMGGSTHTNAYVRNLKATAPGSVRFLGHVTGMDYWTVLQNSRFAVFPTEIEGMSIALLEAMGQSRPVIYSDIPENEEVAGGVGLSFKCGDAGDLARRMLELVKDPELERRLGSLGKMRVEQEYNWDVIVRSVESVYKKVVAR